ncbi:hypothetical protein BJ742DRAFT_771225 [Cladochytrium replicatum]|nr:hypothetical protein BJ742DRAFT_771225 [Cladochytrium replicatum]
MKSRQRPSLNKRKGRGRLFNQIGKNLGLWETVEQAKQGGDLNGRNSVSSGPGSGVMTKGNPLDQINQQYPYSLKRHLFQSLQTLEPSRDLAFRAEIPGDPYQPPPGTLPQNSLSDATCSIIADNNLVLHPEPVGAGPSEPVVLGLLRGGFRSISTSMPSKRSKPELPVPQKNTRAARRPGSTTTIEAKLSFNKNLALFFNARYYIGLHLKQTDSGRVVSTSSGGTSYIPGQLFHVTAKPVDCSIGAVSGPP